MVINKRKGLYWLLMPAFFLGCVSPEAVDGPVKAGAERPLSEIFKDMEKLPDIEDPDPEIKELKYGEIFAEAYLMRVLADVSSEDPMPLYLKNMLRALGEQVRDVDPQIKERFENASLNYLVGIMDPRLPLDPQLEQVLAELLEKLKLDLSLPDVPVVEGLEELKSAFGSDRQDPQKRVLLTNGGGDDSCAQAVFMQYGSGARACGTDLNLNLEIIESTYLRRMYEAALRFEERNELLLVFELEQLPIVVEKFREVLIAVKRTGADGEVEEIRANIGYLAAAYAYHLRLNVPRWHEYGVQLVEWYYYKEMELIEEIRLQKEAEADIAHQHCIDWVNGLIIDEVKESCAGEEPILY